MTNLKLEELRKKSGAFISQSDFQIIKLEYQQYLQEKGLKDTAKNVNTFIKEWIEEQESWGTFISTEEGFKYYDQEDDADGGITFRDYAEKVDAISFMWETKCRKMWEYLHSVSDTRNADLVNELLKEETITYEMCLELQNAVKDRVAEICYGE